LQESQEASTFPSEGNIEHVAERAKFNASLTLPSTKKQKGNNVKLSSKKVATASVRAITTRIAKNNTAAKKAPTKVEEKAPEASAPAPDPLAGFEAVKVGIGKSAFTLKLPNGKTTGKFATAEEAMLEAPKWVKNDTPIATALALPVIPVNTWVPEKSATGKDKWQLRNTVTGELESTKYDGGGKALDAAKNRNEAEKVQAAISKPTVEKKAEEKKPTPSTTNVQVVKPLPDEQHEADYVLPEFDSKLHAKLEQYSDEHVKMTPQSTPYKFTGTGLPSLIKGDRLLILWFAETQRRAGLRVWGAIVSEVLPDKVQVWCYFKDPSKDKPRLVSLTPGPKNTVLCDGVTADVRYMKWKGAYAIEYRRAEFEKTLKVIPASNATAKNGGSKKKEPTPPPPPQLWEDLPKKHGLKVGDIQRVIWEKVEEVVYYGKITAILPKQVNMTLRSPVTEPEEFIISWKEGRWIDAGFHEKELIMWVEPANEREIGRYQLWEKEDNEEAAAKAAASKPTEPVPPAEPERLKNGDGPVKQIVQNGKPVTPPAPEPPKPAAAPTTKKKAAPVAPAKKSAAASAKKEAPKPAAKKAAKKK
jgi:hypothetical protein